MINIPFYEEIIPIELQGRLQRFFAGDGTFTALDLHNVLTSIYGLKSHSSYYTLNLHPQLDLYFEDSTHYRYKVAAMCNLNQFTEHRPKWVRVVFELEKELVKFHGQKSIPVEFSFGSGEQLRDLKETHDELGVLIDKPIRIVKRTPLFNERKDIHRL